MAELPHVGKHCSVDTCKQLDFLPFVCDGCLNIYCSKHRTETSHECSKSNKETPVYPKYVGNKAYSCYVDGCSRRDLTPIICEHCEYNFCLRHRLQTDHNCEKLGSGNSIKEYKSSQHIQQIVAYKQNSGVRGRSGKGKSSKTAAKVALMKMKMHATGNISIPEMERLYLLAALPSGTKDKTKAAYFSKKWSVGKVIDEIASQASLRNNNNLTNNTKILKLFSGDSGNILTSDLLLEQLLKEEVLFNGSSVMLEYVDRDCTHLENLDAYLS